jgi:hypothetical protein
VTTRLAPLSDALTVSVPLPEATATPLPTWIPGQLLVSPSSGQDLAQIARSVGAEVVRDVGHSGYGVLAAPEGVSAGELALALERDGRVDRFHRHARIQGAGNGNGNGNGNSDDASASMSGVEDASDDASAYSSGNGKGKNSDSSDTIRSYQWHLDAAGAAGDAPAGVAGIVVAVLDTGVAWTAAQSLASSAIVAPWDFVNDDEQPLDDHQHGTHIASIIASDGEVSGVAPGAALMPLKVLDQDNAGYEHDLIEAIWWAAEHGADVLNMSLSFGSGYAPSGALLEALQAASDAGVVMVAATGNAGLSEISWPADSPLVMAISATCIDDTDGELLAPYANRSGAVDLLAPGGCLDRDDNGDGLPDGILAETIDLQTPDAAGYWFMAGTSQAAAVVSGAAARLLALGHAPQDVRLLLQQRSADHNVDGDDLVAGMGMGPLDAESAERGELRAIVSSEFYISMLAYLVDNGDGTVSPAARLTLLQADLNPPEKADLVVSLHGDSSGTYACELREEDEGQCVITGPAVAAAGEDGAPAALAWRFKAETVHVADNTFSPGRMLFVSEELEALASALNDSEDLREALLALYWAEGSDEELGSLAESWTIMDSGAGFSSSPLSLLLTPAAMEPLVSSSETLDGSGFSSSPLSLQLLSLYGTGFSSSPLCLLSLTAFEGSGFSSSPLARSTFSLLGSGLSSSALSYDAALLDDALVMEGDNPEFQRFLDDGGWSTLDGDQAGSLVTASSLVEAPAEAVGSSTGDGAVPLE